jgi:hypothetical protein
MSEEKLLVGIKRTFDRMKLGNFNSVFIPVKEGRIQSSSTVFTLEKSSPNLKMYFWTPKEHILNSFLRG